VLSKFNVLLLQNIRYKYREAPVPRHLDSHCSDKVAQLQTVRTTGCYDCAGSPTQTAECLDAEKLNLQQQHGKLLHEPTSVWKVTMEEKAKCELACTSIATPENLKR
jgi:hypothetical protein